jgi:hypothetical protein
MVRPAGHLQNRHIEMWSKGEPDGELKKLVRHAFACPHAPSRLKKRTVGKFNFLGDYGGKDSGSR